MRKHHIVLTANRGYALTSSRTSLIKHFLSQGWQVVIATADDDEARSLCDLGAVLEPVKFNRGGLSPGADLKAYRRMQEIYQKWQPQLVQHFHAKPVILGSLAARKVLKDQVKIINVITGLGHVFIKGGPTSYLAGIGYRLALLPSDVVVFQNQDDQKLFLDKGWATEARTKFIASSGVNTTYFHAEVERDNEESPVIVMLGRLIAQKGTGEFAQVAGKIRERWPSARFLWAGEEDKIHPDTISADWLRAQEGVEYLGRLSDVKQILAEADLLLFPSYREGLPRTVLEAAAMELPTVGFDVPGVREAVRDGSTGYLVPFQDVEAMAGSVATLLDDASLRRKMGKAARNMVEIEFDSHIIEEKYFQVYRELGFDI